MVFRSSLIAVVTVVAFSSSVIASEMGKNAPVSNFDYQGQANLGLAPENPEEIEKCRKLEEDSTAGSSSAAETANTSSAVLSTSTDLEQRKRRCAALLAAALGTAGFVSQQAAVQSTSAATLLGIGGAIAGGALLLAANDAGGSDPLAPPVPLPIPGVGLLSYLFVAFSGAFLWLRNRVKLGWNIVTSTRRNAQADLA